MARAYRMTSARRAAIRKAQQASARKRRGKKKKVAIGAGVAGLGVIGVTMYASMGRGRGKKSVAGPVNVVTTTMAVEPIKLSESKEIDLIRFDLEEAVAPVYKKDGTIKKFRVDAPLVGQTKRSIELAEKAKRGSWRRERAKRKMERSARGYRGRGQSVVGIDGVLLRKIQRNRANRNKRYRDEYDPKKRSKRYEAEKLRNPKWLQDRATTKANNQAIRDAKKLGLD